MNTMLADRIDALLPQTQCRKCGFNGCRPYAEAMADGLADINRCPPGGDTGIAKLAEMLGTEIKALDPECGQSGPRMVAVINEADCIGCTKCLPPCPTDAIVGASKWLHTVISDLCTGCELCVAPCPVNCISLQAAPAQVWGSSEANQARLRYRAKNRRLAIIEAEKLDRLKRQKQLLNRLAGKVE